MIESRAATMPAQCYADAMIFAVLKGCAIGIVSIVTLVMLLRLLGG